ncbi:MAG: type II secretion system F family protein [Shimia sp.]
MTIGPEPLIYIGIFVGVLLAVQGIYLAVFGRAISLNSKVSRRIEIMKAGAGREEVLDRLRKEMDQHMAARRIPLYSLLAEKAQKGGVAFSPGQLMMIMGGLGVAAFVGLSVGTTADLPIRIGLAVAMGIGSVTFWVFGQAKKRMGLIEEQLPEAVELMVRSLKVGNPFVTTLATVANEVPDPIASEFGLIADEAAYGRDVGEALKHMAERLDMQDLRFLAVAVTIQQQSGGNLAEILAGLATVIRARFRLFRRVKAITSEAKWSGMFLSGFPFGALIMINLVQPNYYDKVMETSVFVPACLIVGGFLVANVFVMRMLVNIKV